MITMHINVCPRDLYARRYGLPQKHVVRVGFVSPDVEKCLRVGVRIMDVENLHSSGLRLRELLARMYVEVGTPGREPTMRASVAQLFHVSDDWVLLPSTDTFYVSVEWKDDTPPWWEELAGLDLNNATFPLMLFVDTPGHDYKMHGDVIVQARRVDT